MTVGERIRTHRKEKGFTQQQLANEIGVSVQRIRKYESDKGGLSLHHAILLSDLFGCDVRCFDKKGGDKNDNPVSTSD